MVLSRPVSVATLNLGVWVHPNKPYGLKVPKENQATVTRKQVNRWWAVGDKCSFPTGM